MLLGLLALGLSGCLASAPRVPASGAAPPLRPDVFFAGETRGFGLLQVRGGRAEVVEVASAGAALPDGTFRLDQTIRLGDGPPTDRSWTMAETAPGVWTGTLSDADGPTTATVGPDALRIRYRLGRFTTMTQRLTLEPDGRAALNVATVRFLGVPVARLVERIRRIGSSGGP